MELDVGSASSSLILAVYSSASCDDAALMGCSADQKATVDVTAAKGKTFFVAVGATTPGAAESAELRVDR